ncbi:MAG: hypothetical protein PHD32_10355 [Eubacteriales bacterium]|nr:hypothetical protein [Eubacteriales bacterium]
MSSAAPRYYSTRETYGNKPSRNRTTVFFRWLINAFTPRHEITFARPLSDGPCVFVCNHAKAYGPIVMCTKFPRRFRPWVTYQVCFPQDFTEYAMMDFWPKAPKALRPLLRAVYRGGSFLLPHIMCGMEAVPVYRDQRSIITFRKSVQTLGEGLDLVVFAETDRPFSPYVNDMDAGFADVGNFYRAAKKKALPFYPVYVCRALRRICVGEPVYCDPTLPAQENRTLIAREMTAGIDALARALPAHKPIHYRD